MPEAKVELAHRSPWELLVATILSAQCTDQRVNQVTPVLFKRYKTPSEIAKAKLPELEQIIRSTGFFKSKAKNLVACAHAVMTQFHGDVPDRMEDLVTLPGVGRKTANVLLGQAFHQPAIVVDTHVKRVSNRLRLTRSDDPVEIDISPALDVVHRYRGVEDTVRRAEEHARRARNAIAPFPDGGAQRDLFAAADYAVLRDR